VYKFAHRP